MGIEGQPAENQFRHLLQLATEYTPPDELVSLYTGYRELLDEKGQDVPTRAGWLLRKLSGMPETIRRFHQTVEIEGKELPIDVWYEDFKALEKAIVINIPGVEHQGKRVILALTPRGPRWRHPDIGAWYDLSRVERPTQVELTPFKEALELLTNK